MSPHRGPSIIKYCVITSTAALVLIAINTSLIFLKTSNFVDQSIKLQQTFSPTRNQSN